MQVVSPGGGGGGTRFIKKVGMLVENFDGYFETNLGVTRAFFDP